MFLANYPTWQQKSVEKSKLQVLGSKTTFVYFMLKGGFPDKVTFRYNTIHFYSVHCQRKTENLGCKSIDSCLQKLDFERAF